MTLNTPDFGQIAPQPGQLVSVDGWVPLNRSIFNKYPIHYKISDNWYAVIATTKADESGNAKVVANSSLVSKRHEDDRKIYFTSFDSNPPFVGLGRIALELLKNRTGKEPVPSGPIAGAYAAYHGMGMQGFVIEEGVLHNIKKLTQKAKDTKSSHDFNIEDKASRDDLSNIQKEILNIERLAILKGKMEFKP